ncbi:MAG: hypothetical protein JW778_05025 [Candidatus Altiarchaeota archaeon]|nr:hypothetical protein [Candidatus Altiarchaeota archaeon]
MLGILFRLLFDFRKEVRKEADYIAETIGNGIRRGFEEGFDLVSREFFKLMVASFSVVFGILFLSYGFAVFLEDYLGITGVGFLAVGILGLLLGLLALTSMRRK